MADTDIVGSEQYLRKCTLIVYDTDLNGLDLSELRIVFSVKRSDTQTPNTADIRVYNLSDQTALSILLKLSPTESQPNRGSVLLQAGYPGNFGVIFQGNIKQVILGKESGTDNFVDIIAGDGDRAYNFAVVNTSLASGSTQTDQLKAVEFSTTPFGVTLGHVGDIPDNKLPRGKVMFGNAKNYLRNIAANTDNSWSIQDEKITFVGERTYLPGEQVVLTSKTGMIGTPQQTTIGVNVKCLLNPFIKIAGLININEASVADFKIDLSTPNSAANIPAPFTADGVYFVLVAEHTGDTRGVPWYTSLICIYVDPTSPVGKSIQVGI